MDIDSKIDVLKNFAEEVITEDELKTVFERTEHPIAYDGFEPSGIAPIHFGLLRAKNVKKMLSIGIKMKLYLADYFAFINNKLDGDLDKIRMAGNYFIEVWKACGIDTSKVEIIWAKDLMDSIDYWDRFMHIGKVTTIDRVKRAITIMGRKEGESLSSAQLFYPIMQATDIFQMDIDICQLGMDQRRANILAREAADRYKWKKPTAVHHPLVLGLQGIPGYEKGSKLYGMKSDDVNKIKTDIEASEILISEFKMSKSNPKSAIYMHDSYDEIKEKINNAFCPEKIIKGNPLFNFLELILLKDSKENIIIDRPEKFGGNIEAYDYNELVKMYEAGKIHPLDLKKFVTDKLEAEIQPVREHFEKNKHAKELYETVKRYKITR